MGGIEYYLKISKDEDVLTQRLKDIKNNKSLPLPSIREKVLEVKKSPEYERLKKNNPHAAIRLDQDHMQPLYALSRMDFPRPYSLKNLYQP
ncbi:hypothetical protein C0585_02030 [Candidatus Woesearchaeota archaeon]|nr:MAG: hypothetical protein C0585_02030 [Candidatus Woesearchaeota archaeon]